MGIAVDISNFAVWSVLAIVLGSMLGNVIHIVKKHVEAEGLSEISAFRKWVVGRPFTTAGAFASGIVAAWGVAPPLAVDGSLADLVRTLAQSVAMGVACDSFINRPRNGSTTKKDPDSA